MKGAEDFSTNPICMRHLLLLVLFVLPQVGLFLGCGETNTHTKAAPDIELSSLDSTTELPQTAEIVEPPKPEEIVIEYDTTLWTDIHLIDTSILLDIRYATDNNFMGQQIYDCGRCWLRPDVAQALLAVQQSLAEQGLGLKMYDCYRPAPYQQRLWDKVPDPRYVANPARGSVHSRGAAVDLTLVDLQTQEELDMGTDYDFFGPTAHSAASNLPAEVLKNRQILQAAMRAHGFLTIRTEWWHFNYSGPRFPLSEELWGCE
ncbi:MAG: D-alanyl-D-alanine dipeptidase [Bacteroidota bacterium]